MHDVMLLQAIFGFTMIVLEIPSGYFSDVLGRKRTLVIGGFMHTLGWIAYAFAHDFTGFLIAEMLLGVGAAFISGTDSAMLYDTLLELNENGRAVYEEGRLLASANFSEAAASVVGGFLAIVSLQLPFYLQILVILPVVPLVLMLEEPIEHRRSGKKAGIGEILDVVLHVVHRSRELRYMIATSSFLGAATLTLLWMYQPYWSMIGIPVGWFGIIWAVGNALVGVVSLRSAYIAKRFGELRIMGIMIVVASVSALALGLVPSIWMMPFFAVFYATRGVANPIFTKRINQMVDSSVRATVLSIRQLGVRLMFVAVAPSIGSIGDASGLPTSIVVVSIGLGILGVASFAAWQRHAQVNVA